MQSICSPIKQTNLRFALCRRGNPAPMVLVKAGDGLLRFARNDEHSEAPSQLRSFALKPIPHHPEYEHHAATHQSAALLQNFHRGQIVPLG